MTFLAHPLIVSLTVSLISITFGTYYITRRNTIWARIKDTEDRAINFLEYVADTLNKPISTMFYYIRNMEMQSNITGKVDKNITLNCYRQRFKINLKCEELLSDYTFYKKYCCIIFDLDATMHLLCHKDSFECSDYLKIDSYIKEQSHLWGLPECGNDEKLREPYNSILKLHSFTFRRAISMLRDSMIKVRKIKNTKYVDNISGRFESFLDYQRRY
jgi:hypothetical protein